MSAVAMNPAGAPALDLGVGIGATLLVAGLVGAGVMQMARSPMQLELYGALGRIDAQQVRALVRDDLQAGFLAVDRAALADELQSLHWVRHARVQKLWPDRVAIHLHGHQPLARWGQDAVLTVSGTLIPSAPSEADGPIVDAPDTHAQAVVADLQAAAQTLPEDWTLLRWQLGVAGDRRAELIIAGRTIAVEFGRAPAATQWRYLIDVVAPVLKARWAEVAGVDLRYRNGFAVRWSKDEPHG